MTAPTSDDDEDLDRDEAAAVAMAAILAAPGVGGVLAGAAAGVAVAGTAAAILGALRPGRGGAGGVEWLPAQGLTPMEQAERILRRLGISRAARRAVLRLFGARRLPDTDRGGVQERMQRARAALWRARYLINAARRLDAAAKRARAAAEAAGDPPGPATEKAAADQLERERRYWRQHLDAERARVVGGRRIDKALAEYGPVLGWVAIRDGRTTRECRIADGHRFDLDDHFPVIGLPGVGWHGPHNGCRCRPGAPDPRAGWVNDALARAGIHGRLDDDDH